MSKPREGAVQGGARRAALHASAPGAFDPVRPLRTLQQVADGVLAASALTVNHSIAAQIALVHIGARVAKRVGNVCQDLAQSAPAGSPARAFGLAAIGQVAVADGAVRAATDVARRVVPLLNAFPWARPR